MITASQPPATFGEIFKAALILLKVSHLLNTLQARPLDLQFSQMSSEIAGVEHAVSVEGNEMNTQSEGNGLPL